MAEMENGVVKGGDAEKENTPTRGIRTRVLYYASKKLQKKLAEEKKFAGREQEAIIVITNEKLKEMLQIYSNGDIELNLKREKNICDFYIAKESEYEKRGDEADGWIARTIYHIVTNEYYFDEEITDENVILRAMKKLEEKKKKLEAEIQEKQKKADEEYEKRRKEFIEKKMNGESIEIEKKEVTAKVEMPDWLEAVA